MRKICIAVTIVASVVFSITPSFFDSTTWAITAFCVGMVLFPIGLIGWVLLPRKNSKSLNKKAEGIIVDVRQTNMYINKLPVLKITLTFQTETGEVITAAIRESVDFVTIPSIVPGCVLPLRYNEKKPEKIELDYEAD